MAKDVYITQINRLQTGVSDIGEPVCTETARRTPAQCDGVKRSEFYQAAAAGLKPTIVFRIYEMAYTGARYIEYGGVRYRVLRTYPLQGERVEIVCTDDLQENTE